MHKKHTLLIQVVVVFFVLVLGYLNLEKNKEVSTGGVYRSILGGEEREVPADWPKVRDAHLNELVRYEGKKISFSLYLPKKSLLPLSVYEYPGESSGDDQVSIVMPTDSIDWGTTTVRITEENARRADNGWQMYFARVKDEAELLAFIRNHYGPRCVVTETRMEAGGVLDLQINNEGVDSPVCSVAGPYFIKYDPDAGRVATWMVGNGGSFAVMKGEETVDFWYPMGESLSF